MYAEYEGPNLLFLLYAFFLFITIFKILPYCPKYSYFSNFFMSDNESLNPIIYTKFFFIILYSDSEKLLI